MRMANAAFPAEMDDGRLLDLYRTMLLQRAVDNRGFQLNRQGKIAIAMGSEGHEAAQAGTGAAFERGRDLLYPYYRNTGLLLACGIALETIFRSQLARATDRTAGRSIINHISAHDAGVASISSIIAAHLTHAAGAAFALRLRGEHDRVVFAQFGDGATSAGEWHEAMNFAAVHRLPMVFVCENNRWAISTPIEKQTRVTEIARKAAAYGMPGVTCDGFDPVAVWSTVRDARRRAADGGGPTLVEAICYRFLSHTTDDDDRTYRSRESVELQRRNDPLPRFARRLVEAGVASDAELTALAAAVKQLVDETTERIEAEPSPEPQQLYGNVYADEDAAWR